MEMPSYSSRTFREANAPAGTNHGIGVSFAERSSGYYGDNGALRKEFRVLSVEKSAATKRAERVERKTSAARPCPGCGMKVYVPKTCFCW